MPGPAAKPDGLREEVRITSLAAGGAGVARLPDGMTVFVPRTAPGDVVRLARVRRYKRHAVAVAAEIVSAGPHRRTPVCPHYEADRCGGCQWQHVSIQAQHAAKRNIVGEALRRIGRLEVPDPEIVPSPREFGYRSTVTLSVRHAGGSVLAGFHDAFDPDRVFLLQRCHIVVPELQLLWERLRGVLDLLPRGDDVRLKLRLAADGSLHVVVSGGDRAFTGGRGIADEAARGGAAATVWWEPRQGAVRRVAGPACDPAVVAFAQVNSSVAAQLREDVLRAVDRDGGKAAGVLDLYGGEGHTALPLAERGFDVTMIELDRRAVRRAVAAAEARGISVACVAGRVEDHLERFLPADIVVANPPRAGLGPVVTSRLCASPPSRLVYVSCDPATLARDLARLSVRPKEITLIRCYDMFPQTSHVETLVVADFESRR